MEVADKKNFEESLQLGIGVRLLEEQKEVIHDIDLFK